MSNYLWLLLAWICFVIASINVIAFGLKCGLNALPANLDNVLAAIACALMYTIWFGIIKWKQ